MADQIRGTIQQVPPPREFVKGNRTTTYWSIKVNNVYYSVGSKKPPEPGALVEFSAEQNAKGYWDVVKDTLRVVQSQAPQTGVSVVAVAAASNSVMSKDDYWRRKEERDLAKEAQYEKKDKIIQLQSCRNSAIEFVKLLITPVGVDKDGQPAVALKLPAAVAKREEVLAAAVEKYTQEFVEANNKNNEEGANKNNEEQASSTDQQNDQGATSTDDSAWV